MDSAFGGMGVGAVFMCVWCDVVLCVCARGQRVCEVLYVFVSCAVFSGFGIV